MKRINSASSVAVKPTYVLPVVDAYLSDTKPTQLNHEYFNMIQEELMGMLDIRNVTPSVTDDNQLKGILWGAGAINANVGNLITNESTYGELALVASRDCSVGEAAGSHRFAGCFAADNCGAFGDNAAAIASQGVNVGSATQDGNQSAIIASDSTTVGKIHINSTQSIIAACRANNNFEISTGETGSAIIACSTEGVGHVYTDGFNSAAIACNAAAADPVLCDGNQATMLSTTGGQVAGANSASLAALSPLLSTTHSVIIASENGEISGAGSNYCALIASLNGKILSTNNTHSAIIASINGEIDGSRSAIIASTGATNNIDSDTCALLAGDGNTFSASGTLYSMISASNGCTISGASEDSAIIASEDCEIQGICLESAMIGCTNATIATGHNNCVLIGANNVTSLNANSVGGGSDGAMRWQIKKINASIWDAQIIGSWNSTTAPSDFAEMFENEKNEKIDNGLLVTNIEDKIRPANIGEEVIGVISATAGFIGSTAEIEWHRKYLRGEFGECLFNENGLPKLNPEYEEKKGNAYKGRKERPEEWSIVGLMGVVYVRIDDIKIEPRDYIKPRKEGIGTKSNSETNLRVLKITTPYSSKKGYGVAKCLLK